MAMFLFVWKRSVDTMQCARIGLADEKKEAWNDVSIPLKPSNEDQDQAYHYTSEWVTKSDFF